MIARRLVLIASFAQVSATVILATQAAAQTAPPPAAATAVMTTPLELTAPNGQILRPKGVTVGLGIVPRHPTGPASATVSPERAHAPMAARPGAAQLQPADGAPMAASSIPSAVPGAVRLPTAVSVEPAPPSARVSASKYAATLFASHSWYIPPPPPPYVPPPPPPPPPPPMAPPLPFAYLGSYTPVGDPPIFFLARADRVYDVRVGDELDGTYRVENAQSGVLTFKYLPLNQNQMLNTGATP